MPGREMNRNPDSSSPKVALLHYWLTNMRGGELVFDRLCRMFPGADVFTHACIPENVSAAIREHMVHESFIARLPWGRRHCQSYLPLMPAALRRWDFTGYDLVLSSESGPVKGIRKPAGCRHICYCHTPMRYLWDMYDEYYRNAGMAGKFFMRLCRDPLRRYDLASAESVDLFLANSAFVAERIKRIYGRESTVVYPPADVDFFRRVSEQERKYFLFVGQLVCYKRPDLAAEAFRSLNNERLVVVGRGPMKKELMRNAPPNVEFVERVSAEKLREWYAGAKALIFPGVEDFGIVPVEAQAAGCPVVAFRGGGALETVEEGKTGVFFDAPTAEALRGALETLRTQKFHREELAANAARFSVARFQAGIRQAAGLPPA